MDKENLTIKRPNGWRKGQTIFNFMEWLLVNGYAPANQQARMADPFHLSDERLDELYNEFLNELNQPDEKGEL